MQDQVIETTLAVIAQYTEASPDQITLDSSFEDLALDSLDGVSIIADLEYKLNVIIPNEEGPGNQHRAGGRREPPEAHAGGCYREQQRGRRGCMTNRRVVVTGLGVISALGPDRTAFWHALRQGQPGIAPLECVDATVLRFQNGAEVQGYQEDDHFDKKQRLLMDRFAQFGLIAAREAIADGGVAWTPALKQRTGVVTGSGYWWSGHARR